MKTLSAALVAFSMALAASSAAAAPVSFADTRDGILSDGSGPFYFNDSSYVLPLTGQTFLSGTITTFSTEAAASVDITSAYLQWGSTILPLVASATQVIDLNNDETGTEVWSFSPQWLSAGDWTLHVVGVALGTKGNEGYTVQFDGESVPLPEPTALALVAAALAGLALTRRRSR